MGGDSVALSGGVSVGAMGGAASAGRWAEIGETLEDSLGVSLGASLEKDDAR